MEGVKRNQLLVLCILFAVVLPSLLAESESETNTTSINRRQLKKKYLGPCKKENLIDRCWRCDPLWDKHRERMADCAQGFGQKARGGKGGKIYVVTDPSDDDVKNPKPGTLRYGVTRKAPLWIIFSKHMTIKLQQDLIFESHKTIDGRGHEIHFADGAGFMIQHVKNVIISDIHMHNIVVTGGGMIMSSEDHVGIRGISDGDSISIFNSTDVWIDHCSFSTSADGLIDVVKGSTDITISNCHFNKHDKALLFGASDVTSEDKIMRVTVAFNHFGKGLTQRLPAVRWGFVHVVNNDYTHWNSYAIGGDDGPTIISEGNRYRAADGAAKEITYRKQTPESVWKHWTWRSVGDEMLNGAFFRESGDPNWRQKYRGYPLIPAEPAHRVPELTQFAGANIGCRIGKPC